MSILVTVTEDGKDRMYFRIVNDRGTMYIERPDRASIHAPELLDEFDLPIQVSKALEVIQREDSKWQSMKDRKEVSFPTTSGKNT